MKKTRAPWLRFFMKRVRLFDEFPECEKAPNYKQTYFPLGLKRIPHRGRVK